jgi:hypothetical protein
MLSLQTEQLIKIPACALDIKDKLKGKKYLLQFLPEKIEELSKQKTTVWNEKKLKVSYLIDIVHNLMFKYYVTKELSFNLSSLILRQKYGTDYNFYIQYLENIGILKLVSDYCVGKKTKTWQISKDIFSNPIRRFKNEDSTLLKKYLKSAIGNIADLKYNFIEEDISQLKQKLIDDLFYVTVDSKSSLIYLDMLKQDLDSFNKNKFAVDCISDKHIYFHFDNYGRLHTNFTILKSFIRKNYLKIDGEETHEIDLNNSQPLFLCKLIQRSNRKGINEDEFTLFKNLSLNGNLYQYLIDNSTITDRRLIKEMVYVVLFGKNFNTKSDALFRGLFPTIHNFIREYKRDVGNYKILSHDLQKAESGLIFNQIVGTVKNLYPEIRMVTIHDSIIFPKKYRSIVEGIFNEKVIEEFKELQ